MKHRRRKRWLGAWGLSVLASACGGLAESGGPSRSGPTPDIPLDPSAECDDGRCEGPPALDPVREPPAAPAPPAGRICDDIEATALDVSDQSELNALAGCERIVGSLTLRGFPGMDASPLRSLKRVDGALRVNARDESGAELLSGLGALEEVNSLLLDGLSVPTLKGLGRLQRIGVDSGFSDARGRLLIRNSPGLQSLQGLDALESLEELQLRDNPALTSLAGLVRVRQLQSMYVDNSPLQTLDGLQAIALQRLALFETQLRDLTGLGEPSGMTSLSLSRNSQLVRLEGAARLPERLDSLMLIDNPQLRELRGLEGLREVGTLNISNSDLTSLAGLQALERVTTLTLEGLPVLTSLRGLEALRDVNTIDFTRLSQLASLEGLSGLQQVTTFTISESPALSSLQGMSSPTINGLRLFQIGAGSLAGLENVTVNEGLMVTASPMTSVSGLPRLAAGASLNLNALERLADLDGLSGLTSLFSLSLYNTNVANLDDLSGLRQLGRLELGSNPRLTQIDGLAGLTQLNGLSVIDNPALLSLPVFAALESVPCSGCQALSLQVERNPELRTGPSLPTLARVSSISVLDNTQLTSLDGFATLEEATYVSVQGNVQLLTLPLPLLSRADEIRIRYNTELDDTALTPLRERAGVGLAKIVSNRFGASGLSPCPWLSDYECDETVGDCAPGTDINDCLRF